VPLRRSGNRWPETAKKQLRMNTSSEVGGLSQPVEPNLEPIHGIQLVAMQPTGGPGDLPSTGSESSALGVLPRTKTVLGVPGAIQGTQSISAPTVKPADERAAGQKLPTDAQHDLTKIFEQFGPNSPEYLDTALAACHGLVLAMASTATRLNHSIRVHEKDQLQLPKASKCVGYDPHTFDETK
jgi:hypothetical protein